MLWLPCTMHCQAEALGWLGGDSTCCEKGHKEEAPKPDCADCAACSAIESGSYSLPQKAVLVPELLAVVVHFEPSGRSLICEPAVLSLPTPDRPPQLLRQSWSFRCRTALAPRAPAPLA
jgi:hypothetical protein